MKSILASLLLFLTSLILYAQKDDDVVFWWDFNDSKEVMDPSFGEDEESQKTVERIKADNYDLVGLGKYVPGVVGSAFKFDGFSSYIEGTPSFSEEEDEPLIPREITVEAWVSLGAYPWNWAPILTIGKYKVTGFYLGVDSRGRVGFHLSDATSVWHECNSTINPQTKLGLELNQWYHIAATYSPEDGISLYVNGELQNTYNDFTFDYGVAYSQIEKGFRMGMNREDLPPTDPIRDWATYPSRYTLDGIVDEVKIRDGVLTADQLKKNYQSIKVENEPQFEKRNFPSIRRSGRFDASYTRLKYYPEWDALWPVGDHMDVVVQFEDKPVTIMFWRGTRYSPALVTENGKWMVDQSRETGNNWFLSQGSREDMATGCIEHMSDVQTRSSRVSIIEDHAARKVINWRYLQMDVLFRQLELPNNTGFGEWGNELYYIFPDGVAVRKVLPGRGGWQETIFLNEPGTRPEDNIELEASTLMNLKGDSKTYSWENGYPVYDLENANIQITNLKSEYKPFMIFREGGGFDVFNLEVRPEYSHFPWWNHWPVAQIISDGRSANAPDRAAHSSLSWGDPGEDYALYGLTNLGEEEVLKIARSWNNPPEISVGEGFEDGGYDYSQRGYSIRATGTNRDLKIELKGSDQSPVYNTSFIVENYAPMNLKCKLNEKYVDIDYGVEYNVEGDPVCVIWIEMDLGSESVSLVFEDNS